MKQVPKTNGGKRMRTYLGLVLSLTALVFASVGQVFATSPSFGIDSSCSDGTYPVNCGPITITVTSLNSFSGTVTLTTSVSPSCSTGYCLTPTLTPSSVIVPAGGTNSSKLTFTHSCNHTPNCKWLVTITGTSGTLQNSTSVFVCYGHFCPI